MIALLALVLAAPPRFLAPAPESWTTQPSLRVFVEAASTVELRVNEQAMPCTPGAGAAAPLVHCTVALVPGRNVLRAVAGGDAVELTVIRAETTGKRQPGVADEGFGTAVHRAELEARCQGCHEMREATLRDGGSMVGSTCASCHDFGRRVKVHGPVEQGACLACHDAASEPRYAVRWPIQETCFRCHVDIQGAMNAKAFRHGPAAAGRCTTCHDPHGSDQPFWLKKRAFDLCTNCHTEKKTERHVVVGFVYGDAHPLQGRPHPLKPNTEFACPACHNPHAAQSRFLWQFEATRRETLCRTCHQK